MKKRLLSEIGIELGIVGASVTAIRTADRLFTDGSPARTMILIAALTHGVCLAARKTKLPWLVGFLIGLVTMITSLTGGLLPETARWRVVPTTLTGHVVHSAIAEAWRAFLEVRAPADPLLGFTLVGAMLGWLLPTIADALAFRLGYWIEALIPSLAVVVLTSVLAPGAASSTLLVPYLASIGLVAACKRTGELSEEAWLSGQPRWLGITSLIAAFVALSAATIGIGHAPSWVKHGRIDVRNLATQKERPATISTANPLVSTQAHLVNLPDRDLFIAATDVSQYWRLTSLDVYTHDQWTASTGTYRQERARPSGTASATITLQDFDQPWLPIHAPAESILGTHTDGTPAGVSFDRRTQSVLIDDRRAGDTYSVETSAAGSFAADLQDDERARLVELPTDLDPRVPELATRVTSGALDTEAKMRALEQFFQTAFRYDLKIATESPLGLTAFLFDVRRGYCEQFASSFAVLARTLGVPARVAIGFIPGTRTPQGFQVRGEDAHAWPEVYFSGAWHTFEPTPGRGATSSDSAPSSLVGATSTTPPATTSPSNPGQTPTTVPEQPGVEPLDPIGATGSQSSGIALVAFLVLAAFAVIAWVPPAIRRLRIARQRFDDGALPTVLAASWRRVEDAAAWHGANRRSDQPVPAWARFWHDRAFPSGARAPSSLLSCAERIDTLRYSVGDREADATNVKTDLEQVRALEAQLVQSLRPMRRLQRHCSVRVRPR